MQKFFGYLCVLFFGGLSISAWWAFLNNYADGEALAAAVFNTIFAIGGGYFAFGKR